MMDRARELLSLEASWTDQAKLIGSDGLRSSLVNVEAGESGWTKLLRLDIEQIERALGRVSGMARWCDSGGPWDEQISRTRSGSGCGRCCRQLASGVAAGVTTAR
jgi:hypothetical protein